MMKLFKTDNYNEDDGCCLFLAFSYDEQGNVLGEPPEVTFSHGYLEDGFDGDKWTHFIKGCEFDIVFEQADPKSFPPNLKSNAFKSLENAVSKLHQYACSLPIGDERTKAFAIYQEARHAPLADY